jgi:hypothetical protein
VTGVFFFRPRLNYGIPSLTGKKYIGQFCRWLMDAERLFRDFYYSLGLITLTIEYGVRKRGGSPSEVLERPWLLLRYVEQELGRHNAELVSRLFMDFVGSRGVDPRAAAEALSGPEGWGRFVVYLRSRAVDVNEKRRG